jgi:hypothetical protein
MYGPLVLSKSTVVKWFLGSDAPEEDILEWDENHKDAVCQQGDAGYSSASNCVKPVVVCGSDDGDEYQGWVAEAEGCKENLPELGELRGFESRTEEWDDGGMVDESDTDDEGVAKVHALEGFGLAFTFATRWGRRDPRGREG